MRDEKQNSLNELDVAARADAETRHREQMLDEALEETFPASDPVSVNLISVHRA